MKTLHYFGTSLNDKGHYFWTIVGDHFGHYAGKLNFQDFPFNPENLIDAWKKEHKVYPALGQRFYFNIDGWSILYFEGSPTDPRPASKSVFFVNENISENQLLSLVHSTSLAKKIIEAITSTKVKQSNPLR